MPDRGIPQARPASEVWLPGRDVVDDHEPAQGRKVAAYRLDLHVTVEARGLRDERLESRGGGGVASEGVDQRADARRVTPDSVESRHIHAADVVDIALHRAERLGRREAEVCRPAADDDPLGDLLDRESGIRGGHLLAGEDGRERCAR